MAPATDPHRERETTTAETADVLIVFGITGDLARKMTLRSLYRLEARGLLDCPIVGVGAEDWSTDHLREHTRTVVAAAEGRVDARVMRRLVARLTYVGGDFGDPQTFARLKAVAGQPVSPVHYLEIPPGLFRTVVAGLDEAGLLPPAARVVVEKPFGHDLASARRLAADLHEHLDEAQLYRVDHFLGKMALDEILYLRFANGPLLPVWNRHHIAAVHLTLAESFGVQDRGSFYDAVGAVRDVIVNHLMQVLALVAMEAPAGHDPESVKHAKYAVLRAARAVAPGDHVTGQYRGYRQIDGVRSRSDTETYAALRLFVDNERWDGVPFLLRAGKRLHATATEVRVVFRPAPRPTFLPAGHRPPAPSQLVLQIDPDPGTRIILDARRADARAPQPIDLDMRFDAEGGRGPTPYEVLLHDALRGDSTHFTRQDIVEETWRIVQPLLDDAARPLPYAPGSWGPASADALTTGSGGWYAPW
jgi:glucose-6-phosphate 1-dehydrogenase